MKFIHAADLHLDSPFRGLKALDESVMAYIRQSTITAYLEIIDLAIREQVDFVLFSGDIYDHDDYSIKAQIAFVDGLKKLDQSKIPSFIIHGNHDFLSDDLSHINLPASAYRFTNQVETKYINKANKRIAITGYSFSNRHVTENILSQFPPKEIGVDYHIGLYHGNVDSVDSSHANYAPFSLKDVRALSYDYLALGHIHKRLQLAPDLSAYYSGNSQGLHRNELGKKGCLLVEEKEGALKTSFVQTQAIEWCQLSLQLADVETVGDLYQKIIDQISQELDQGKKLVDLTVYLKEDLPIKIKNYLNEYDLNDYLLSQFPIEEFVQLCRLQIKDKQENVVETIKGQYPQVFLQVKDELKNGDFYQDLIHQLRQQIPSQYLEDYLGKEGLNRVLKLTEEFINK